MDDDGSGNFTEIQDAIDASADGDEIIVCGGTYHESLMVDRSIILRGDGNPVVDGSGANDPAISITAANVTLVGFTITGTVVEHKSGAMMVESQGSMLLNNTVCNNAGTGVRLMKSSNCLVSGNQVHDNGGKGIVLISSRNNTLTGNQVHHNGKGGIGLTDFRDQYADT